MEDEDNDEALAESTVSVDSFSYLNFRNRFPRNWTVF